MELEFLVELEARRRGSGERGTPVPPTPPVPAAGAGNRDLRPDIPVFGPTLENPREVRRLATPVFPAHRFASALREAFGAELDRLFRAADAQRAHPRIRCMVPALPRGNGVPPAVRRDWTLVLRSAGAGAALAFLVFALANRSGGVESTPSAQPGAPASTVVPSAVPASPATLVTPDAVTRDLLADPGVSVVAEGAAKEVVIHDAPGGAETHRLAHPTENGGPLVFLVHETRDGWLRVDLPVRPNGSTGWLRASDVTLTTNPYRIEVSRGSLRFRLYREGEVVMESPIAMGADDTPTPGGVFYVKELLQPPNPHTVYGPYAFGLSGFSNVLDEFNGGQGVIGIHGTDDPNAIGKEVSHGCIRLSNEDIVKLVGVLPLGTPVAIIA